MIRRKNVIEHNEKPKTHLPTVEAVKGSSFATMRYFYEFLGKEGARAAQTLINSKKREEITEGDLLKINRVVLRALKKNFPSLIKTGMGDMEQILFDRFADALAVVKTTEQLSFPDMELEFGLLTPTQYAPLNVAKQLVLLMAQTELDTVDPILAHELIRQLALSILSIQFHELNLQNKTRDKLAQLVELFEQNLIAGPIGNTDTSVRYGIYDNQTNGLLSEITGDLHECIRLWQENSHDTHIKELPARVRQIPDFGEVLFDYRSKGVVSATIKAIYEAMQCDEKNMPPDQAGKKPSKRKHVDLSVIPDLSGFLFVVDAGKEAALIEKIVSTIRSKYPDMTYRTKHKTKTNNIKQARGSSSEIEFKRIMVRLEGDLNETEIEIMVYNWSEYSTYRLHVGDNVGSNSEPLYVGGATDFYTTKRTTVVSEVLFPEKVYAYSKKAAQIRKRRSAMQQSVAEKLRKKYAKTA